MHAHRSLTLTVSALVLLACNQVASTPAVELSWSDVNSTSRWRATLATPAALADGPQMSSSASMTLGSNSGSTNVQLVVANAPSGLYQWAVHRGQCGGADEGVFGPIEANEPMSVGADGRAAVSASIPLEPPTTGLYFVSVRQLTANGAVVVACGNLVPPTQYAGRK